MTNTGYFEASVDMGNRHLLLGEDCVGKAVTFSLKEEGLCIILPHFDLNTSKSNNDPTVDYTSTSVELNWTINDNRYDGRSHGDPKSWNKTSVTSFVCDRFIVRSSRPVSAAKARALKKHVAKWSSIFILWLEALDCDDLEYTGFEIEPSSNVDGYFIPNTGKARRVKSKEDNNTSIRIHMREGLSLSSFKRALKFSEAGSRPPEYYLLLVGSLRFINQRMYRQAVLDAATAFEMCLHELLDNELKNITAKQRKLITDKHKMIGGLCEALRKLGVKLPSRHDIDAKIADPRNLAIHHGMNISELTARNAHIFVKEFIYRHFPLDRQNKS